MTNSIDDIREAGCIFSIGSNTTTSHPVIGMFLRQSRNKGTKIIVANPREIDLVRSADIWLQHRPGTDVALLMGMMKVILDDGLADMDFVRERCENFEAFQDSLSNYPLDLVEKVVNCRHVIDRYTAEPRAAQ